MCGHHRYQDPKLPRVLIPRTNGTIQSSSFTSVFLTPFLDHLVSPQVSTIPLSLSPSLSLSLSDRAYRYVESTTPPTLARTAVCVSCVSSAARSDKKSPEGGKRSSGKTSV